MLITNASVLTSDFTFKRGHVLVSGDGTIRRIELHLSSEQLIKETGEETIVNAEGAYLIPGLIDVHMHGYAGVACDDFDPERLSLIGQKEAYEGVTGYAASFSAMPDERAFRAIKANLQLQQNQRLERNGSRMLGFHMEGPFLNPVKKGGMSLEYLQAPSKALLDRYIECSHDQIKIMTIAPEFEGSEELIRYGSSKGIAMSLGHTNATLAEANLAIHAGAVRATHTFNAMHALNHRDPGVLGAVLSDDSIECEMISDLVHVAPEVCKMIVRCKTPDKVTVISDSFQLAGVDQSNIPEDIPVIIKDAAYLKNGTLCGSIITVMDGVRNLCSIGIKLEDAVKMASLNPAKDLKLDHLYGSIQEGKQADLVMLDPSLLVKHVWIGGVMIR